jgi:hypothetical protein
MDVASGGWRSRSRSGPEEKHDLLEEDVDLLE